GLGLGLTLVKRLVELHGGSVSARSDGEGRGSTFIVRLPLTDAAVRKSLAPETGATRRLRVVLVEDDSDIRQSMQSLLELFGHAVETAADGEQGLELICRARPEIALLDVGLPGVDGL